MGISKTQGAGKLSCTQSTDRAAPHETNPFTDAAIGRALERHADLSGLEERLLHLLIVLAANASDRSGSAWPEQSWLARRLRCTDRQVRRLIAVLRLRGYVRTVRGQYGLRYFPDLVALGLAAGPQRPPANPVENLGNVPLRADHMSDL